MFIHTNDVQTQSIEPATLDLKAAPVTLSLAVEPVTLELKPGVEDAITVDPIMFLPAIDEAVAVTLDEAVAVTLPAITTTVIDQGYEIEDYVAIEVTSQPEVTSHPEVEAYTQDQGVIATLYANVLDRQADAEGFQWWSGKEVAGDISLGGIAISLLESEEFVANNNLEFWAQSTGDQIESLYQTILGRDSDQAGKDYWIEQTEQHGLTMQEIAQAFVDSEELAEQTLAPEAWDFLIA